MLKRHLLQSSFKNVPLNHCIINVGYYSKYSNYCASKHEDPDNKVYGANMGPTWVLLAPDGPHVGPMNLAIRGIQMIIGMYCVSISEAQSLCCRNRSLKTKGHQFDDFVVTGGTVSCPNDNLRCQLWRQSCQIDYLLFSLYTTYPNNHLNPSCLL